MLLARDRGIEDTLAPLPFDKAAEKWLEDCERRQLTLGRLKNLKRAVHKYFVPFFKKRDIKIIKPSNVSAFLYKLDQTKLSAHSVNTAIRTLKAMFNFHLEEDNILRNPVKRKHKSAKVHTKPDEIVWTPEEAKAFLDHANRKYRGEKRWVYLIYKIAMNTGMRQGEVIALEKGDVDFDNHRIRVNKFFDYRSKSLKSTKTGKPRYVPLSPKLAEEIREYVIELQMFGSLFVDKNGDHRSQSTLRNIHYLRDIEESGVRKTKFHNMRRYFNTVFIENGGREPQLRQITGHSSLLMTDLYTARRDDMSNLAKLVNI